jgi:hypothetical protein
MVLWSGFPLDSMQVCAVLVGLFGVDAMHCLYPALTLCTLRLTTSWNAATRNWKP